MLYYQKKSEDVYDYLKTSSQGLSQAEAQIRLEDNGFNELETKSNINLFKLFIYQFKSFIIYILLFAVILSVALQEYIDATIIVIILLVNALIGFFQELSAHKSLKALEKLNSIKTNVYRDEKLVRTDARFLVPGDIVYLEAGDKIPADLRIVEANRLKVEESALTGESLPVEKNSSVIHKEAQIGDQKNMLFSSTTLLEGTAKAVVVETAMHTEIGKITSMIRETKEELTPLQKKLDDFGRKLGYVVIGICVIILVVFGVKEFLINGITYALFLDVFLIAVALAVAAVPEGLPAVVTITLSIGVKKLLRKKALVRKLSSVETLGSCNVICSDKTGTLTKNEMTVQKAWVYGQESNIEGVGYSPQGVLSNHKIGSFLFEIGAVCNNSSIFKHKGMWRISGDPTEAALLVSAKKANVDTQIKKLDEIPFDSSRKLMSVLVEKNNSLQTYVKGAPDNILKKCTHILIKGKKKPLTKEIIQKIHEQNDIYAKQALRVLGFAYKDISNKKEFKENNLIFVGLQAMIDPPRPDVIDSIQRTKEAGIRVIMITGDYKETARAIGKNIGIGGNLITGEELSKMSSNQLKEALRNDTNIFARVIPEHKQSIVSSLQELGNIVAMTGDGVNDAPALKKANIGVAVGSGTDVAKEASDFVLLDDSFTNIVNAIEEGRGIYDNIQKTIMHLLSGNLSEVLIIFLAVLFGWNLPLTAIMLLWINLITDGAPALALAVDPYNKNVMSQKPKPAKEGILPKKKLALITLLGGFITILALTMFKFVGGSFNNSATTTIAQTMVFLFIVLSETILLLLIRNYYGTKMFSNIWIWLAFIFSIGLQFIVMYTPLSGLFEVVPLSLHQLGIVFGAAAMLIVFSFITKWFIIKPQRS